MISKLMLAIQVLLSLVFASMPLLIWNENVWLGGAISGALFALLFWPIRCLLIGHVFTLYGEFHRYDANGNFTKHDREHFWYCRRHGCDAVNPDTKSVTDQIQ